MPILSEPTSEDSDGDGILDSLNNSLESKTEFADPNPLRYEFLWEWPAVDKDTGEKLTRVSGGFIDNRAHGAIDIGTLGIKQNVVAAYDGEVIDLYSEYYTNGNRLYKGGCGNYIFIKHIINGETYYSRYIHLDSIEDELEIGTKISAGQKIAVIGQSGGGYQIHLDFQIGQLDEYSYYKQKEGGSIKISGSIIDPVLFDTAYSSQAKKNDPINIKLNMLMNIPADIQNVCLGKDTDGDGKGDTTCDDCYEYFKGEKGIYKKYKIKERAVD